MGSYKSKPMRGKALNCCQARNAPIDKLLNVSRVAAATLLIPPLVASLVSNLRHPSKHLAITLENRSPK